MHISSNVFSMVLPFPSFPFLSFILLTFSIEGRKREIRERKRSHTNGMSKISTSRYYMIIFFISFIFYLTMRHIPDDVVADTDVQATPTRLAVDG